MASSSSSSSKQITLKSSDGETFEVNEKVASMSVTVKNMIEDMDVHAIPLPNVTSKTLSKVIEYCNKHVDEKESDELKLWDKDYVKVDKNMLFDLILAANYLDIRSLLDLTCLCIADMIKDYSVEQVRELFGIANDFTPEEEAEIRKENAWAFDNLS